MTRLLATRVVTPHDVFEPGVVETDGGVIGAVESTTGTAPSRTLVPGFIDLQVNGHGDIDVTTADGTDWDRLDAVLIHQGVTTWCPAVVTAPVVTYGPTLDRIGAAADRVPAGRPAIAGVHLEGPFLGAVPGAHPSAHIIPIDIDWISVLPPLVKVVTLAPELPNALDAIRLLVSRGVTVSLGHSTATYEEAQRAIEAGASLVTHLFNAMSPLHHREPGLAGAGLVDDRVVATVIADGVHLHPGTVAAAFRAKPGGIALITDAVAHRSPRRRERGIELRDGAPRLPDGTIAGSALTIDAAIRFAVDACRIPFVDALRAATATPAGVLGLADRGVLAAGRRADIVALDDHLRVTDVWIGGQPVAVA